MKFVGIDLHKKTITIAVVDAARKMLFRKRFSSRRLPIRAERGGQLDPQSLTAQKVVATRSAGRS